MTTLAISSFRSVITLGAVCFATQLASAQTVVYVDRKAPSGGNGSSWGQAIRSLQQALSLADSAAAQGLVVLRVADGTYRPDQGPGLALGDTELSFRLRDNVTIEGGYAGVGAASPGLRDPNLFRTILSGKLGPAKQSRHVVVAEGVGPTAVLDGVTIERGLAAGPDPHDSYGGGLLAIEASPTIQGCVFQNNTAGLQGRDAAAFGLVPAFSGCEFSDAGAAGAAGVYLTSSLAGAVVLRTPSIKMPQLLQSFESEADTGDTGDTGGPGDDWWDDVQTICEELQFTGTIPCTVLGGDGNLYDCTCNAEITCYEEGDDCVCEAHITGVAGC